jgi:predicted N-acyltransferase
MRVEFVGSIDDVAAADWNGLVGSRFPFLRHEFLSVAEQTGCVSPATGWQPSHALLRGPGERLKGALPLYEKTHSWGEFVFDWAWAQAYHRAGLEYYPKLVSAVPFTPAPSPRLLLAEDGGPDDAAALVEAAIGLATRRGLSSLHVLFPLPDELPVFEAAGLMLRKDCQFHWHNAG